MFHIIEPYINDILVAFLSLLTALILTIFAELRKRVLTWLDSRNDLRHQEYLTFLAEQAFSYVEQTMKDAHSQAKLNEAIRYTSDRLEQKKINLKTSDIRAAIEKAVLEFNKSK